MARSSRTLPIPEGGAHYRCGGCRRSVVVFLSATVVCSRCGRIMRRQPQPVEQEERAAA